MSVSLKKNNENSQLSISVKGPFNFSIYNEFRDKYSDPSYKDFEIIIDLKDCTMIDSSALGMLLIMKKYLDKKDGEVTLINANSDVMNVLDIVHFEQKFTIK